MKNGKNQQKTREIKIRVTEDDYNRLSQVADENGSSVPQAARWLLFKKGGGFISDDKLKNLTPCTETTCREYLKVFKNEVTLITKAVNKITELTPDANDVFIRITIQEMLKNIIRSHDIIVSAFGALNVSDETRNEIKNISIPKTKTETKSENPESKNKLKKYFYIQKISICGSIAAPAETFTTKTNTEIVNFTVVCDEKGDKTSYDVYASTFIVADIIPMLTSKRQVFVTGNFRVRSAVSKSGILQNPLSISADSVTLGMEKLA